MEQGTLGKRLGMCGEEGKEWVSGQERSAAGRCISVDIEIRLWIWNVWRRRKAYLWFLEVGEIADPPPPPSRLFDVCFARLHSFYLILLLSIAPGNMFFLYDENKRQNCVVYLFTLFVCLGREGFVLRSGFRTFGAMRFAKNLMFGYSIFCLSALYRPCCVGASMIARDPIPKTREKRK